MSSRFDNIQSRSIYVGASTNPDPALGNLIIDGSAGIGITNPLNKLSVSQGSFDVNSTQVAILNSSNSQKAHVVYDTLLIQQDDAPTIRLYEYGENLSTTLSSDGGVSRLATTGILAFNVNGSSNSPGWNGLGGPEVMRMIANGNVGIGTTSPYTKLDVNGTVITTGTLNSTSGSYSIDHPGINTWKIGITSDNSSTLHIGNDTGGSFASKILNITAAGAVGISTTSPIASLDNQGSLGTYRQRGVSTMVTNILYADGTSATRYEIARATIDYNDWNETGIIEIELYEKYYSDGLKKRYLVTYGWSAGANKYLVEMSGTGANNFQVTIGSPVVISGDLRYLPIYVELRYYNRCIAVVKTNRNLTTDNPPGMGGIWFNNAPAMTYISDFSADSAVYAGNVIGGNTIFPSGNIGIGTTAPTSVLTVNGNAHITGAGVPSSGAGMELSYNGGISYIGSFDRNNSLYRTLFFYSSDTIFENGGSERMRITSGGNVGIGTTNPLAPLDVNGNSYFRSDIRIGNDYAGSNTAIIKWQGGSTNSLGIFTWGDLRDIQIGGKDVIFASEGGSERMRINTSGSIRFNQYGSGSFTGTKAYDLAVDSSGNIIEVASGLITVDRATAISLMQNGQLVTNANYLVTDVFNNYYYEDGSVILTAISPTEFSENAYGNFYVAKPGQSTSSNFTGVWNNFAQVTISNITASISDIFYNNESVISSSGGTGKIVNSKIIYVQSGTFLTGDTITGQWSGTTATISVNISAAGYQIGHVTKYGGKYWTNLTGNIGYDDSGSYGAWDGGLFLDSTNWSLIPASNSQYYEQVTDYIIYDVVNDLIKYREDKYGNKVYENSATIFGVIEYQDPSVILFNSNILYFEWNNKNVANNKVEDLSLLKLINTFASVTFNTFINYQTIFNYSVLYDNPKGVAYQSTLSSNRFYKGGGYNINGSNFYVGQNDFTESTSLDGLGSAYISENTCGIQINVMGFGGLQMFSNRCKYINVYSSGSTTSGSLSVSNNTGNGISIGSIKYTGGFNVSDNTFISNNTISSCTFRDFQFNYNTINSLQFYNSTMLFCTFSYNNVANLYFSDNTFDCSSYTGYDPEKGFNGNVINSINLLSFTYLSTTFNYNNFTGRSGFTNNEISNSIYFQYNSGNNCKIIKSTFNTSQFTNNTCNDLLFSNNELFNGTFASNVFSNALLRYNTFQGYNQLNNFNNGVAVDYNTFLNGSNLFRSTFSGGTLKYNLFTGNSSISDVTSTSSIIEHLTFSDASQLSGSTFNLCNLYFIEARKNSNFTFVNSGTLSNKMINNLKVEISLGMIANLSSATLIYSTTIGPKRLLDTGSGNIMIEYFTGSSLAYAVYTT